MALNTKMNLKPIILFIAVSALLQVLLSPLRGYVNINAATIAGYIAYALYTGACIHYFSKKISVNTIVICVIAGVCILQLPLRIISFKSTLFTLPDMLLHIGGVLSAYFYYKFNDARRWIFAAVFALMAFFMVTKGYELWSNILDNGSVSGKVNETKQMNYHGRDKNSNLINGTDFKPKITLLDFWFIGCKPCYIGFPELQRVYDKYKHNNAVKIYALNLPQATDQANDAFDLLKQQGYSFPNLVLESNKKAEEFGVKACPTTILLDENRRVIFRGGLSDAEKYMEEIL